MQSFRLGYFGVLLTTSCLLLCGSGQTLAQKPAAPAHLPGELSADAVLNGEYPYPASPAVEVHEEPAGFARERLGAVPPAGVHPRVLISPDQLPDLRTRLRQTDTGRKMYARLKQRLQEANGDPKSLGARFFARLEAGDKQGAVDILNGNHGMLPGIGHYEPWFETVVMESFIAMVEEDTDRGHRAAQAIATWCKIMEPLIDLYDKQPLADDAWRGRLPKDEKLGWASGLELRSMSENQLLGYAYDFDYNYMNAEQRDVTRRVIGRITAGRVWMGARLPHHFRNWNWVAIGLSQPLLALAIEGEPGYDARVYKLGVEIARDYITYGVSPTGEATEAVGYSNFGLVWATPFYVAAARRGEDFLIQSHNRRLIDWYLHSEEPWGGQWESHGDGGDGGPSIWNMSMWKYFYPKDPAVDYLWQTVLYPGGKDSFSQGRFHPIEPLLWVSDPAKSAGGKLVDYGSGKEFNQKLTLFDPLRGSLNARNNWTSGATAVQFECRTDSVGASHEHADRGNFTLSAMGRQWAKESFRSVETRYHNLVTIDGLGQGYWPGPGKWVGEKDGGWAVMAASDARQAYDSWWPKEITTEAKDFVRYQYPRWDSFAQQSADFHAAYAGVPAERDRRPSVVQHFAGFEQGDPRMWDEDAWPVALPFNPVQRTFRTIAFVRHKTPYLMVVDDIQKDEKERNYEWLMMTGANTDVVKIDGNDIVLADATAHRGDDGLLQPRKGERELLIRVLDNRLPATAAAMPARTSFRLETLEKRDMLAAEGRSWGLDKRLVITSRSVAPNFKILLLPMRAGDPLPVTAWNADKTELTITIKDQTDSFSFRMGADGRNRIEACSAGEKEVTIP